MYEPAALRQCARFISFFKVDFVAPEEAPPEEEKVQDLVMGVSVNDVSVG